MRKQLIDAKVAQKQQGRGVSIDTPEESQHKREDQERPAREKGSQYMTSKPIATRGRENGKRFRNARGGAECMALSAYGKSTDF